MRTLIQDFRFGFRMLIKNPGVTLAACLALAIGIGANSTIFTMINSILLSPLPFPNAERIMRVSEFNQERGIGEAICSGPNYLDWKERSQSFESMALITNGYFNLTGSGRPERVAAYLSTPNFFSAAPLSLKIGRTFLPDEDQAGKNHVVILSHGLWKERYGSDPEIVNKTIQLDGESYTVIGVLPEYLGFLEAESKMWLPLPAERVRQNRNQRDYAVVAKLKPGVSLSQAQSEMDLIGRNLALEYPKSNTKWGIAVEPLMDKVVRLMKQTFIVLHGAVGFVLLISCSIVASLLLARAGIRRKEIAIRSAMGASRSRIVRQLLTESILMSLIGGGGGLILSLWGIEFLKILLPPLFSSFLLRQGIDGNVVGFTMAVSLSTGLLFGLAPALQTSKINLTETLKEGGISSGGRSGSHRILRSLVVIEIALSLILLSGAGLMANSFIRMQRVNPGFNANQLLTLHVSLPATKYGQEHQERAFYKEAVQSLAQLPGVRSVGAVDLLPMTFGGGIPFKIEGRETAPDAGNYYAELRRINPEYFQTLEIPLLKGRFFNADEENEHSYRILIDETLARRFWPDQDPIGKTITIPEWSTNPYQIVGVVGSVKHFGLIGEAPATLYISFLHRPSMTLGFALQTSGNPLSLASSVRERIWAIDPDLPIEQLRTMEEAIADKSTLERFGAVLLMIFSGIALVLAAMGIYGIMAYSISQRTYEIGIRIALGAQVGNVISMVVRSGAILIVIGLLIGLAGAFAVTRILASSLYEVSTTDPVTYITVVFLLTMVSLCACYLPARRAAKVDPMTALRYE